MTATWHPLIAEAAFPEEFERHVIARPPNLADVTRDLPCRQQQPLPLPPPFKEPRAATAAYCNPVRKERD